MKKLDMKSMDITGDNIAKVRALFPSAVTEVMGDDGKVKLAIDFDCLKQELSEDLISERAERYQMTWPDKSKAKVLANSRITATLRPDKEKSVDFDNTENLYIEGDNLDVLKLLRETYLGKVKMIYIDPPYNTGNDFVYEDDFAMSAEDYAEVSGQYDEQGNRLVANTESNGRFHTDWLNMMYPRLKAARDLLDDKGVIFISIGEEELFALKLMCDEIFGQKNYISNVTRVAKTASNMGEYFAASTDYILCYAKNIDNLPPFKGDVDESLYKKIESEGKYIGEKYRDDVAFFQSGLKHGGSRYPIVCPDGQRVNTPDNKPWRANEKTFNEWLRDGRIVFKKTTSSPLLDEDTGEKAHWNLYTKSYLFERQQKGTLPRNILTDFINRQGADLIKTYGIPFDFAKPLELMKFLLKIIDNKDCYVLDFFSGSATTAHAVMQMNAEDGGNRKFIMVQLPEKCDEKSEAYKVGYKNICEIGEARIRRSGMEIKEKGGLTAQDLDVGFRVLRLDSSNMQEVYYNPAAMTQDLIASTVDNVKADRTPLDLLFQVMLDLGIELSAKIKDHTVKAMLAYTSNNMPESVVIRDPSGHNVYKVVYEFSGYTVSLVNEYGFENGVIVEGNKTAYDYSIASGRTTVTTFERDEYCDCEHEITTVYTFDDEGNPISNYVYTENFGNTGIDGEVSGIHPYSADGGATIIPNNTNLLYNHTFAKKATYSSYSSPCIDYWQIANECCSCITMHADSFDDKFRKYALLIDANDDTVSDNVVYQTTAKLPAGDYTFSAYVKVKYNFDGINPGAYLRVYTNDGIVLAVSEKLVKANSEYIRLIAPFKLFSPQAVRVEFVLDGMGAIYVCAPQLENNPFANEYNMLQNGNFELGDRYWNKVYKNCKIDSTDRFNMSNSACIEGATYGSRYCSQIIYPITDRSTRETFTLSGWAKGYGLPMHDRHSSYYETTFRLRARIKYYDPSYAENGYEDFTVDFSPCTEDWQFVSLQFSKSKYRTIDYIEIFCDYDYNFGTAFFDDIQLVRNSIETGLTANDFVVEEADEEVYTEENNTDTKATDLTEHVKFTEVTDDFGNTITETTFTDGEFGTIYRSFGFTADGNDLVTETDSRGNKTTYEVEEETSRNKEVTDRCGNKTAYEYDDAGRTTKVTSKNADGAEIASVSYAYDAFDNMTKIARGDGMAYDLTYNEFHNLKSIGVAGRDKSLIEYTYKNGNGRLKEMTYANGDKMHATYNSTGQMVGEAWTDKDGVEIARYKYVYDGQGNIVRSIDILGEKEYNYIYSEGTLIEAITSAIKLSGENVVGKTAINTIRYIYDTEGKQTKKILTLADGAEQVYLSSDEDNSTSEFIVGDNNIKTHSKTDSFGRKLFDEFQLGSGFVSRQFSYHVGEETREHKENAALKSSPTTQLVSGILLSDGRTLSYEYDAEERITSVTESYKTADNKTITNITEYTYDALGQLLTETVNGSVVNSMKYDNYGNIVSKNGKKYVYGDEEHWYDLLTSYDGYNIEYDAQGNPVNYLGHTLTWEKGRQLKSFDNNTYTYNANGIRTSKTINGVKHEYVLDGTKILRETWGENTLIPIYDDEESVCGIIYNGTPHYFLKNLQGDIIAIANSNGEIEARYAYDAWGAITNISGTDEGISIAVVNPFRYRSYYYDVEIGLYYLQSRYYDPNVSRFINGDSAEIGILIAQSSNHLFLYCDNSPISFYDFCGYKKTAMSVRQTLIFGIMGFVVNLVKYGANIFKIFKKTNATTVEKTILSIMFLLPINVAAELTNYYVKHFAALVVTWGTSIVMELAAIGLNAAKASVLGLAISVACIVVSVYLPKLIDSVKMIVYGIKNKNYYWDKKWYGIKYYNKK